MDFEYDPEKSLKNKAKHGISFEGAKLLWFVPAVHIAARMVDEPRYMIIGRLSGAFYSCVYTMRGERIRLISARRSRKFEKAIYYEKIN